MSSFCSASLFSQMHYATLSHLNNDKLQCSRFRFTDKIWELFSTEIWPNNNNVQKYNKTVLSPKVFFYLGCGNCHCSSLRRKGICSECSNALFCTLSFALNLVGFQCSFIVFCSLVKIWNTLDFKPNVSTVTKRIGK